MSSRKEWERKKPQIVAQLRKRCRDISLVLLYVMNEQKDDDITTRTLYDVAGSALKWSIKDIHDLMLGFLEQGIVKRAYQDPEPESDTWKLSGSFSLTEGSCEFDLARELVDRNESRRESMGEKYEKRERAILDFLMDQGSEPISTDSLFSSLRRVVEDYEGNGDKKRTLLRDLKRLSNKGRVEYCGGWVIGKRESKEPLKAKAMAFGLQLLFHHFKDALPEDMQRDLHEALDEAMNSASGDKIPDKRARWLDALEVVSHLPELAEPRFDDSKIGSIQKAIMDQRRVRITGWNSTGFGLRRYGSHIGSISHYLLQLPGKPAIIFWPDEEGSNALRFELQYIEDIEVLSDRQARCPPKGFVPKPLVDGMRIQGGGESLKGDETRIVLRVKREALFVLQSLEFSALNSWVVEQESDDEDGWSIVSFNAVFNEPLFHYLSMLKGVVVLSPALASKFIALDRKAAMDEYKEVFDSGLIRQYAETEGGPGELNIY